MKLDGQPRGRIRLAVPDDASSIVTVLYRSFVEYEASYTPEAFAVTTSTPDRIRDRLNEGPVWVALQNDIVVGTLSVVARGEALYIRGMAVDPDARGKGIGRKLLEKAEEYAIQSRFNSMFLSTTPFLNRAIRLYEQFGFSRSNDGPEDLFGTPLFTMVKRLLEE